MRQTAWFILFFTLSLQPSVIAAENRRLWDDVAIELPATPEQMVINKPDQNKPGRAYVLCNKKDSSDNIYESYIAVVDLERFYSENPSERTAAVTSRLLEVSKSEESLSGVKQAKLVDVERIGDVLYVGLQYVGTVSNLPLILKYSLEELDNGNGSLPIDAAHTALTQSSTAAHSLSDMAVVDGQITFTLTSEEVDRGKKHVYGDAKLAIFNPKTTKDNIAYFPLPNRNPVSLDTANRDKDSKQLVILAMTPEKKVFVSIFDIQTQKVEKDYELGKNFLGVSGHTIYDGSNDLVYACSELDRGELRYVNLAVLPKDGAVGSIKYGSGQGGCRDLLWMGATQHLFVADHNQGTVVIKEKVPKALDFRNAANSPLKPEAGAHPLFMELYSRQNEEEKRQVDLLLVWENPQQKAYLSALPTSELGLPPRKQ